MHDELSKPKKTDISKELGTSTQKTLPKTVLKTKSTEEPSKEEESLAAIET